MQDEQPPGGGIPYVKIWGKVVSVNGVAVPEPPSDKQRIVILEGQVSYLLKAVQRLEGDHQ